MNQLLNTTAAVNPVLVNDTRFDDVLKAARAQGALVKTARSAAEKADNSLPAIADMIVRKSKDGSIDLESNPEALTLIYREYCIGKNPKKPSKPGSGSEKSQVGKFQPFYQLGKQVAFNGEDAFDLVARLFKSAKDEEQAAKDKRKETKDKTLPVPGPYESKFIAYLEAAKFVNNNASANPAKFPRLDANNIGPWQAGELPDEEITASMESSKGSTKTAKGVLEKIVKSLAALIDGSAKDATGDPVKDNTQVVSDCHVALENYVKTLTLREEQAEYLSKLQTLGVSMAEMQVALHPRPTAGRKRSQRRG